MIEDRYYKAKGTKKGHFEKMAYLYISKYIFTNMFCQRSKLRKKFDFLVVCGES